MNDRATADPAPTTEASGKVGEPVPTGKHFAPFRLQRSMTLLKQEPSAEMP